MSGTDAERVWLQTVGMRVRLARVARRESRAALATLAGVSRVTLGSVERGDHPAGLLVYARVAGAIGVPLAELLDGAP
jgi:transcriptional regulator with XRE-family HTH domain